jgi:hypothetical protein
MRFLLILILGLFLNNAFCQKFGIVVNQDTLYTNQEISVYPNFLNYAFEDSSIIITKGEFIYSRNKKVIHKFDLDENTSENLFEKIAGAFQRESRILISATEISKNGAKQKVNIFRYIDIDKNARRVINPDLDLLINNSVSYVRNGISPDSVLSIEIISDTLEIPVSTRFRVTIVRGSRFVKETIVTKEELLPSIFDGAQTGDRLILEGIEANVITKIWVIPII